MAGPIYADRVKDTSSTTGTGTLTLDNAPPTGSQSFAAVGNGNTCYYMASTSDQAQVEVGLGTYSSTGPTLARNTVAYSTNGNAKVSFSAPLTVELVAAAAFFSATQAASAVLVGDTGSGGTAGIVPAPGVGDAAASKFLGAGGSWTPAPQLIDSNVSYSVGSGGDFATLPVALTYLTSRKITSTLSSAAIRVVLNILPGTLVHTGYIYYINMELKNVTLAGVAHSSNVTSVQSSSGSAGAWSIILNMSDVSNAAVNDYINIMTVTGGVNPTYLAGCHKITNVDAVNSRITIASTHAAAAAPSGATASTAKIMKSILQFNGCHGMLMWDGHCTLNAVDLVVAGNGTSTTQGLSFQDLARGNLNNVAVVGFDYNMWAQQSSNVYCGSVTLSSAVSDNLRNKGNAIVDATAIVLSGAGRYGAYNDTGAMFGGSTALATGNVADGFHMDSGAGLQFDTPSSTGNIGWGYSSKNFSPSVVANFAGSGNTLGLINSQVTMSDGGDVTLPTSLQSTMGYGTGIIYKGSNYFLHNFNYGNNGTVTTVGKNLFLGELAGNLSSGVSATNAYEASDNTGIGYQCLYNVTIGYDNTAVGYGACQAITSGADNTAVGSTALNHINTAAWNTAVGVQALTNLTTGGNNTAVGGRAGKFISGGSVSNLTGSNSVLIGYLASPLADGDTNEIVIGYTTTGNGSNTVTIGNASVTGTWLAGAVTSPSYIATATITGGLTKGAYAYGTIPYSAVNLFASYNLSVNGYTQTIISNSSNGATASANVVVSNNLGTDTTYYGSFGINSSGFTGTGAFNLPNATYVSAKSGDLALGTEGANSVHIFSNSSATDAITVSATNRATTQAGGSASMIGFGGNLTTQVASAGVSPGATGGDYVLATYTLPASLLDVAGRELKITGFGKFAANGNTKQLKIYAGCTAAVVGSLVSGGTVISDSAALTTNGSGWRNVARIVKYGAAASNTQISMQDSGTTSPALPQFLTLTESGTVIIAIVGNCTTATTDIVLYGLIVEYRN